MCNEIKCAIQYSVDLINNNINRDVQEGCEKMVIIRPDYFFGKILTSSL